MQKESKLNKKAALYVRVSTNMQIDKDSLPLQKSDLINYAKYALDISEYEIFEDAGYSAKNTDRPRYQQMMARLRTGEFSHLIVWKIDRISRNLLDFTAMYEELKRLGVVFVSKNEQFDTSTAIGEAMLKIILIFAELERKMTSERVTAVMLSRANNGQWNGGHVPFGYDYDKVTKQISINAQEAETVQLIYSLYKQERSILKVASYLSEHSITTKSKKSWSVVSIAKILHNPFYIGKYVYNKRQENGKNPKTGTTQKEESEWIYVNNHHEAIIDEDSWLAVDEIMKTQRRNSSIPHGRVNKHVNVFAGLIFCAKCGSLMQATVDIKRKNGYRPSIYNCYRRKQLRNCTNKLVSDITIGPFVLNYISNIIKAQNNFGVTTTLETFEKKLLRGDMFSSIKGIEPAGLKEMYDMLRSGKFGTDIYEPRNINTSDSTTNERELLLSEKRKKERALARLKSLYLYNDEDMPQTEYFIERKSLTDELTKIDGRLDEIERNLSSATVISDADFIAKASYFIMSQQLLTKRYVRFDTMIQNIDPQIVKDFVNSVIKKIVILDGKIQSILFKNGIEHKFLYE